MGGGVISSNNISEAGGGGLSFLLLFCNFFKNDDMENKILYFLKNYIYSFFYKYIYIEYLITKNYKLQENK